MRPGWTVRSPAVRRTAPFLVGAALLVAGCSRDGRSLRPPTDRQNQSIVTTSTSTTVAPQVDDGDGSAASVDAPGRLALGLPWADNEPLSAASTCKGLGTSPAISWAEVPAGTRELAITVTDDSAAGFVHWVIAGLSPADGGIDPGLVPPGAVQAINGAGTRGWYGPCPPAGADHRYRFTLYALSAPSGLTDGADSVAALAAVQRNVLALDVVFGTFTG